MKNVEIKEGFVEENKNIKEERQQRASCVRQREGEGRRVLKAGNDATALKASQALSLSDGP